MIVFLLLLACAVSTAVSGHVATLLLSRPLLFLSFLSDCSKLFAFRLVGLFVLWLALKLHLDFMIFCHWTDVLPLWFSLN